MSQHDDDAYLLDILLAARRIEEFGRGVSWEAFARNELLQDAVVFRISVIGEAASKLSQPLRDAHPDIPWRAMAGMRNRIIHEYFRIDLPIVWDVVQKDIPTLISLIQPLVPPEDAA